MPGGFRESPLHMNRGIGAVDQWGEEQIEARAVTLSKTAVTVWQRPAVEGSVLAAYGAEPRGDA